MQLASVTNDHTGFIDVESMQHDDLNPIVDIVTGLREYYQLQMRLGSETTTHTRIAYSLVGVLSEVGGALFLLAFLVF